MNKALTLTDLPAPLRKHPPKGWPWDQDSGFREDLAFEQLPIISLITPSYQQGQYLEETLRSVLLQNYPKLQYVVIDGGSTDQSLAIIQHYEAYLDYWVSEPDQGQSHAINKGFAKCKGDLVNWLNSDDLLEQDALWKIAAEWIKKPFDLILGGQLTLFVEEDRKAVHHFSFDKGDTYQRPLNMNKVFHPQSSIFLRREKITSDFLNEQLHYVMDHDLYAKFLLNRKGCKARLTKEVFSHFRRQPESKTVAEQHKFQEEQLRVYKGLCQSLGIHEQDRLFALVESLELPGHENTDPESVKLGLADFLTDYLSLLVRQGDFKLALPYLARLNFAAMPKKQAWACRKLWLKAKLRLAR